MNRTRNPRALCFIIATLGHGRGGHFWSLKTTAEAISQEIDCFIIDIGVSPSPVVQSTSVRSYHVPFSGLNIVSAFREVSRILRDERPDVVNLFDGRVDFLARLASIRHRIPLVRTKCGGPPPRRFFPRCDRLILYTVEDQKWFSSSKRFSDVDVDLIPNRIARFDCDLARIAELRSRICPDKPIFMRIARFGKNYEGSMVQGINLVRRLNEENRECQLVLVGVRQDPDVYDRIVAQSDSNVHVFTEDRFTLDAKTLLGLADFVIGTGRGFMEAASLGKVLLTPLSDGDFPLLVTQDTFADVFASNFSPRNAVADFDPETNYREILRALENPIHRRHLRHFASDLHTEYFDIHSALEKHKAVYRHVRRKGGGQCLDLAYGFYLMERWFRAAGWGRDRA